MKRYFFATIIIYLSSSINIYAQYSYTLKEYIKEALGKSYELKEAHLESAIEDARKRLATNYYVPTLTAIPGITYNRMFTQTSSNAFDTLNINEKSLHTELSQNTPLGSKIHFDYDVEKNSQEEQISFFNPEYSNSVSFGIDQPVSRGFLMNDRIFSIQSSRIEYMITQKRYHKERRNLILIFVETYWNLFLAQEDEHIKKEAYERALEQYKRTKEHIQKGILAAKEIYVVEESLLIFANNLEDARKRLADKKDAFLKYIFSHEKSIREIDVLDKPQETLVLSESEALLEKKLEKEYMDYQIIKLQVEESALALLLAKNQIRPQLDLNILLTATGINNSYTTSIDDMSEGRSYNAFFGITFSTPLTYSYLKGQKYTAEKRYEQSRFKEKAVMRDMSVLLRDRLRDVELRKKQYKRKKRIAYLAAKKLQSEEEKYKHGLSTLYDLVLFQRDVANARSDMNSSLVNWHISIDRVYELTGGLDAKYSLK